MPSPSSPLPSSGLALKPATAVRLVATRATTTPEPAETPLLSTATVAKVNHRLLQASTPLVGIVASFLEIAEPVIAPFRFCRQHALQIVTTLSYLGLPAVSTWELIKWLPNLASSLQLQPGQALASAPISTWIYLGALYLANVFVWLFLFFLLRALGAGIQAGWRSMYRKGLEFLPPDSQASSRPSAPLPGKPNFFSRARRH